MSIFGGLTTLLLSLDYNHQTHEVQLPYNSKPSHHHHHPKQPKFMPLARCRGNSLSSSSSDTCISSSSNCEKAIFQYHCPPDSMTNYDNNDTVFGRILRGELPALTLAESPRLLAVEDIKPRAPLHALVIPKAFVGSVFDLDSSDDMGWMQELHQMALELVQTRQPEAYANNDYRLCFHIPPFNSVDHLHLHVLAPLSKLGFCYCHIKYNPKTRWCNNLESVMERLGRGETAVPYRRPPHCKPQKERKALIVANPCDEDSGTTTTPSASET